jgi:hypothetical protein
LHLQITADHPLTSREWGDALVSRLLPAVPREDPLVRAYWVGLGLEPDDRLTSDLVLAYWIDQLAFQLRVFPPRARDPAWRRWNVERVIGALARLRPDIVAT